MKFKKVYLMIIFYIGIAFSQNNNVPFHHPMPSKNYEFLRYGDFEANEYRGLANISINLYSIGDKNFNYSLKADYYSGGIKVNEEAGIIGLGWNIDIPTIVQNVNSFADFLAPYSYKKLPPFQGNPAFIPNYPFRTLFANSNGGFNVNLNQYVGFSGYQNIPYFALVHDAVLVDHNGLYQGNGKYANLLNIYNTEPDIFSVNLNGENIKFCMQPSNDTNFNHLNLGQFIYPFVVINGKNEYKIEAIPNDNLSESFKIKGIKIIDPSGTIYFFEAIEITGNYTSIIYKVSKVKLVNGKEINFTYNNLTNVRDVPKLVANYHKRLGPTLTYSTTGSGNQTSNMISPNYYTGSIPANSPQINFTSAHGNSINYQFTSSLESNYRLLASIQTESEKINFLYSDRIDYQGMKKLDSIVIKNTFNDFVKKIKFSYDYFNSNQNDNCYNLTYLSNDLLSKRLKLNSIQFGDENPYLFEYNSILLPKKNSYSYDYWGFYNGHYNTNPYPNLSHIGFPQFSDNSQNNFNPNFNYTKAASLEKIKFPTGGVTCFEYEPHKFDSYLLNQGSNTPIISSGAGLRLKTITNINNDIQINKMKYSYYDGINISKKILTKQGNTDCFTFGSIYKARDITSILSCNLNNYLNETSDTNGNYIGYSKVVIEQIGDDVNTKGYTEKYFSNFENKCIQISGIGSFYANPIYYTTKNNIENGKLLKDIIRDKFDNIKTERIINYENIFLNENIYGMRTNSAGFHMNIYWTANVFDPHISPSHMLTFYPIFSKFSRINSEKSTHYFPSGSKTTTTEYQYNINNILTGKKIKNQSGQYFYEENTQMVSTTELINKNIFNLPSFSEIKENGTTKKYYQHLYITLNNIVLLSKTEELAEGNPDPSNKINVFYDLYDDKSNLIQYHKENDIYTCIIWGYNKTLPVAKIENVQYTTITAGLITDVQDKSNTGTEDQLLLALENLRNSLPNAFITTYTHKPLVGVSSITDAKGDMITYHYDSNNRLQFVKDKNGNIISENEYHFRPQN